MRSQQIFHYLNVILSGLAFRRFDKHTNAKDFDLHLHHPTQPDKLLQATRDGASTAIVPFRIMFKNSKQPTHAGGEVYLPGEVQIRRTAAAADVRRGHRVYCAPRNRYAFRPLSTM